MKVAGACMKPRGGSLRTVLVCISHMDFSKGKTSAGTIGSDLGMSVSLHSFVFPCLSESRNKHEGERWTLFLGTVFKDLFFKVCIFCLILQNQCG